LFKKQFAWILAIVLLAGIVALAGCGNNTSDDASALANHPLVGAWDAYGDGEYDYYRLVFNGDGTGAIQEIGYPDLSFIWEVPENGQLFWTFQGLGREEWTYTITGNGNLLSMTEREEGLPWFYERVDPSSPLPAPSN